MNHFIREQTIDGKRRFAAGQSGGFAGQLAELGGAGFVGFSSLESVQSKQPDFPNMVMLSVGGQPLFPSAQSHLESAMHLYAPDLHPALRSNVVIIGSVTNKLVGEILSSVPHPTMHGRVTGPVQVLRHVAEDWALSRDELASLLDYSKGEAVDDLFSGRLSLQGVDREDRIRILFGIYRITNRMFLDPDRQRAWLRTPSPMLGGQKPLEVMLSKRIPGMVRVRNVVERLVGR